MSHAYFCLGGYYYWIFVKEGYFAGWVWDIADLSRSLIVLSFSSTVVASIVTAIGRLFPASKFALANQMPSDKLTRPFVAALLISFLACAFVLVFGQGTGSQKNNYSLIAYQFSDVAIPCTLFAAAIGGRLRKLAIGCGSAFFIYAIIVGFRYKLALVLLPLLCWLILSSLDGKKKALLVALFGGGGLFMFSVMTLFRVKFGGLDFSRELGAGTGNALYSFFAESNIVFAMTSVMDRFVDGGLHYYFDPIFDSIKELVPRVIYPDRTSGLYLNDVAIGLVTEEGSNSGTAYPFVGEFAIMGGYPGIVIGTVSYALLYCCLHRIILLKSPNDSLRRMGIGLLAAIMGYYQYSRGYMPQATKSYIFILLPFMILAAQRLRKPLMDLKVTNVMIWNEGRKITRRAPHGTTVIRRHHVVSPSARRP